MVLKLHNTLTKKKEIFKPLSNKEVRMYNCGPTCYSYAHIGNFRAFLMADLLRRWLEWKGFQVKQVMNITDVGHMTVDDSLEGGGEDKIEKSARERGMSPEEVADFYTMAFFEDIGKLNLKKAYFYPRATDHIEEMQRIIAGLLKKGIAYRVKGGVYFDIGKFPGYGRLSGNTLKKLQAGKRVPTRAEKKNPHDFALWIQKEGHLMQWDSPWGRGYPGWHIECSAMSMKYLGPEIDIHTGGEDNIFPHHECEIAQSEGFSGKQFARYWVHTRHFFVEGKKMSKSLGNVLTLRDLVAKGWEPREIRWLLLSAHYRKKMNFTERSLHSARSTIQGMENLLSNLRNIQRGSQSKRLKGWLKKARKGWEGGMDDDLNLPTAMAAVFELMTSVNKELEKGMNKKDAEDVLSFFRDVDQVLGLGLGSSGWLSLAEAPQEVKDLIGQREMHRKGKEWDKADSIRDQLKSDGILLEDTKKGPRWKRVG
ncbi:MAG: cysteine--tRNA ligase [Candidatus Aenigmarchaeota archaeon]|nr:cysteine--tRNA ligase [Candidatus Aenigmarchaeota archaeon]